MIAIGIAFVYYYIHTKAILSKLEFLETRIELTLVKLDNLEIKRQKKEPVFDISQFVQRTKDIVHQNNTIIKKLEELSSQRVNQYTSQPYVGLQADINKIMISMVSLPGKIQNTHNRLDEVLVIWKKMLEMRKK